MAIKNILVVYNGSESSDATLVAGIVMQKKYNAHITGLFIPGPSQLSSNLKPWAPSDVRKSVHEIEENTFSAAKDRFFEMANFHIAPEYIHWIAEPPDTEQTVSDYAPLFDITLIGRRDARDDRYTLSDPEDVAVSSGKPVLVVPKNFEQKHYSNNAVVAWDGKRSVTRALASSLDILALRDHTTLLSIGNSATSPEKMHITTSLNRHSIDTTMVRLKREGRHSIEELIVEFCQRHRPGLLILGLNEPGRFSLVKNTSLTSNILDTVSMPVFLSC